MLQTLDQEIAKITHDALIGSKKQDDKDVRNAIKKAATRLRVSGFGVTMAFAIGKKEQHLTVAEIWCKCLKGTFPRASTPETALAFYRDQDIATIRHITELSERILEWLAKWADAYKPEKPEKGNS